MNELQRNIRIWMILHCEEYGYSFTKLAEAAVVEFDLDDEILDDETHWIWDEAFKAVSAVSATTTV